MNILKADIHGAYGNGGLFKAREQIEQVMWSQSQFRWLDRR